MGAMRFDRARLALAGTTLSLAGTAAVVYSLMWAPAQVCPAGQALADPVRAALDFNPGLTAEQQAAIRARAGAERICLSLRHPEPAHAMAAVHSAHYAKAGRVPDGALRAAVEQRKALEPLKTTIPGADGTWTEYGKGNLRGGGGHENVGARADSFAYDPVNKRLFAALGSAGVWMSEAVNGDVRTLADEWVAVDKALPTTIFSAVAWTPAGGGTLIVVGGEHMMGSGAYYGLGAFWSNDLGATWHQATGVPDQTLAFTAAVDPAHPDIVYAATGKGLFRSTDAGRSYVNVKLPTRNGDTDCAGVEDTSSPCQYTNTVTDVVVQHPGGTTNVKCADAGCPVLAAIGFRQGSSGKFRDGRSLAPANGLYRSATGEPGTFARADVAAVATASNDGFTVQNRIGRTELGAATGDGQDHNYVYATVQDAVLFNDGPRTIDLPDAVVPPPAAPPLVPFATAINGVFVSSDFGTTWTRMADTAEIAENPQAGSSLGVNALLGYAPGIQAWYNLWIKPDPTRQDGRGVPTRVAFGLEEVWQNKVADQPQDGATQSGVDDFRVFGGYGAPTHADQQGGIYIPTGDGGVCLIIGNDGGVAKQCAAAGEEMTAAKWGRNATNKGIYAMLPYGIAVAKDGTVWFGLQDNGSGHIEPKSRFILANLGGDGFYCEVDPDQSSTAYCESQGAGMSLTTNRGGAWTDFAPRTMDPGALGVGSRGAFDNWFTMNPLDSNHLATGVLEILESTNGPATTKDNWTITFTLGLDPETNTQRRQTTIDLYGDAAYVGFCGPCGVWNETTDFRNGIATNVGGAAPPKKASADGWHIAAAQGLNNRFITSIEIDPNDVRTIYVTLAAYYSNVRPPEGYLENNPNLGTGRVFKSSDAGETFRDISGNLPNAAVSNVLQRGSQLLVGTDVGPFISSDLDGTSWAPLGNGLPNVPTTMLRLRPGNPNHLFAATFGRGVWDYEFTGDAKLEVAPDAKSEGRGMLLGAVPPLALVMLFGALALRRARRCN